MESDVKEKIYKPIADCKYSLFNRDAARKRKNKKKGG